MLGHDLRNPLAAVISGARLLGKEDLSERGRNVLQLMNGSSLRMAGLIDNILDFARARLGGGISISRRPTFLEPVIRQVVEELRTANPDRTIDMLLDLPGPVDGDGPRIAQLVSNLVGNAVAHGAADKPIRVGGAVIGDRVEISVGNGGEPISEQAMSRLFQPFFRGDAQDHVHGLGLGLHIASEIAKAHDGALEVASSTAETRFTFLLPTK